MRTPSMSCALLLSIALTTFAAPVRSTMVERPADARDVQVLLQARSVSIDRNGTAWIYHGISFEQDRMAAAVTAIRPDGSTRRYLATDILPPGSLPPGQAGQLYAITPLTTAGLFAATAGWVDTNRRAHNAVVFFHEDGDGKLSNRGVVPAPGARAIASGPNDTVVVATVDPAHDGDAPLLTVLNGHGDVVASWGCFHATHGQATSDRIGGVRLYPIDRDTIAVYDVVTQHADAFSLHPSPDQNGIEVADLWSVQVSDTSDSGATEVLPVTGFAATKDGLVTVVRPIVVNDQPRMLVTRYTSKGRQTSWSSEHFWRAVLVRNDEIRGVVAGPGTWEERVTLAE